MFPFSQWGSFDRGEGKALLAAGAACLVFICFFVVSRPRSRVSSAPVPPKKLLVSSQPSIDPLDKYRIKTKEFYEIDFWNYSYGLYPLSDGKKLRLNLENGHLTLPDYSDSFLLKDVFYRDVTDDGEAEAIVWLSHMHCVAGSCSDSNIFYIFTGQNQTLKQMWQYETGSYARGCGLKSLTIAGRQITVELFGDCSNRTEDPNATPFISKNLTYIIWEFDGRVFKQQSSEVSEASPTRVSSYQPGIRIF